MRMAVATSLLASAVSSCLSSPVEWREFRARLAGRSPGAGSARNEAALKRQDETLWSEYARGVWAHATSC